MKIGIDASRYADKESTGVEWYSWHIINSLIKKCCGDQSFELILYSKEPLNYPEDIRELVNANAGRVHNKVIFNKRLWTLQGLSREMKLHPPEVLFVPSHVLPLDLPKKSVVTIHDVAFRYLKKSYSWLSYKYLNWSTKFAVKKATKIIVPSSATKNDLINFFNCPVEKIAVVEHGFDAPKISNKEIDKVFKNSDVFKFFNITDQNPYILFVGRLESKKNLCRLVQAFKSFSDINGNYKLVLAGKRGIGFDQLLKTIKNLDLFDKIIMPGYVSEEEKVALYKNCKVFAFPSLYEGFGLPILEAFYYGKPVLTSHVSCLPDVAGEAAYFVDPYDYSSISAGLEKIVNDTNYSENLISLGKERLKLFSWDEASRKTLDILLME
jgi:glycosyltransferase involved in cell wall biosynthesis